MSLMMALAALAGGGSGYVQGLREKQQMDINQQNADWEKYQRGKQKALDSDQKALDSDLQSASQDTQVSPGGGMMKAAVGLQSSQVGDTNTYPNMLGGDSGGSTAPRYDGTIDTSQKSLSDAPSFATPSNGMTMSGAQGLMAKAANPQNSTTWSAAGKTFASQGDAQDAATAYNSNPAREMRIADAYDKAGMPDQADAHRQRALQWQQEGALDFIQGVRAYLPDPSTLKDASGNPTAVNVNVPKDLIDNLNKTGPGKIKWQNGYQLQAFENPSMPGHTDARIIDKNGNVLVPSINTAEGYIGMSLADRSKLANETAATKADIDWKEKHGDAALKTAQAMQDFRDAEAKRAQAQAGSLDNRMTDADKMQLQNVGQQIDKIQGAITTSMANGMWNPQDPNAQQLQTNLVLLKKKQQQILGRYTSAGGQMPDPLGLRGGGAPAQPGAAAPGIGTSSPVQVSAADQAGRDDQAAQLRLQEVGGDPAKAAQRAAALQQQAAQATGDTRAIFQSEAGMWARAAQLGAQRNTGMPSMAAAAAAPKPAVSSPVDPDFKKIGDARVMPLVLKANQALQVMRAAARSGDQRVVQYYANQLQAARDAVSKAAQDNLGNQAQNYLRSVGMEF